jgi:hypothetical protein
MITPELHNDLINMGLLFWAIILVGGALLVMSPWLIRKFKMLRLHIRIWGVQTYHRIKKSAQRRREQRRMRIAMKVFDKPLTRWCDK